MVLAAASLKVENLVMAWVFFVAVAWWLSTLSVSKRFCCCDSSSIAFLYNAAVDSNFFLSLTVVLALASMDLNLGKVSDFTLWYPQ